MVTLGQTSALSKQIDKSLQKYGDIRRFKIYQGLIFLLTFLSYALYHANRKVIGVVKTVWNQNCTQEFPNETFTNHSDDPNWCDWAPFDKDNADSLLGWMDASFLVVYAVSMFLSGYLAERSNLRFYLSFGMFFTGFCNLAIGAANWFDIHSYVYFIFFNSLAGVAQATGWPAVVTLMGNWFGKSKRGLIMGTWNIHTSVGNIAGSAIAAAFVSTNWGLSFAVPALVTMVYCIFVMFLIIPQPSEVHLQNPNKVVLNSKRSEEDATTSEQTHLLSESEPFSSAADTISSVSGSSVIRRELGREEQSSPVEDVVDDVVDNEKPISLIKAAFIPGVMTYALALFFVKFVNYVFMYWLPKYINSSTDFSPQESANMSMFFDVGGIMGGMTAGALSDKFKKPANTCFWMLVFSVPMLYIYFEYGSSSVAISGFLLILVGFFVCAPYALITTAVSAALGTHESLQGNSKALATVAALIDGTGSLGAALGPLLTGIMEDNFGWTSVFYMLFVATVLAMLCLIRLVIIELKQSCSSSSTRTVSISVP